MIMIIYGRTHLHRERGRRHLCDDLWARLFGPETILRNHQLVYMNRLWTSSRVKIHMQVIAAARERGGTGHAADVFGG
jgi:hypothetical protein